MRRVLIVLAIVLALLLAVVLAALFTQPRPKLTVTTLGVIVHTNGAAWVRVAVTNHSDRFVVATPGVEEVTGNSTNRMMGIFERTLNPIGPHESKIIEVWVFEHPDFWRPVLDSRRPFTRTRWIIAMLRKKFAPRMKIAAIDERFSFFGPWRKGTNAEPGDVVGVAGK